MEIQEGKYYRTRGGWVFGPAQKSNVRNYQWEAGGRLYLNDGGYDINAPEHEYDLINEITVQDIPAETEHRPYNTRDDLESMVHAPVIYDKRLFLIHKITLVGGRIFFSLVRKDDESVEDYIAHEMEQRAFLKYCKWADGSPCGMPVK